MESDHTAKNCYNTGEVSASGNIISRIGGICGQIPFANRITDCYQLNSYGSLYGKQLTSAQMRNPVNFVGFDFETIWSIDPNKNNGYPYLKP